MAMWSWHALSGGMGYSYSVSVIPHSKCRVDEEVELTTPTHAVGDVRVNTCYIQGEGSCPGEGDGGVLYSHHQRTNSREKTYIIRNTLLQLQCISL